MLTPGTSCCNLDTKLQPGFLDIQATNIEFEAVVDTREQWGAPLSGLPVTGNVYPTEAAANAADIKNAVRLDRIDLGYTTEVLKQRCLSEDHE